jgi:hypothetical protein
MVVLLTPEETPRADPHAGCCGGWGGDPPGIRLAVISLALADSRKSGHAATNNSVFLDIF